MTDLEVLGRGSGLPPGPDSDRVAAPERAPSAPAALVAPLAPGREGLDYLEQRLRKRVEAVLDGELSLLQRRNPAMADDAVEAARGAMSRLADRLLLTPVATTPSEHAAVLMELLL